jgi:ribosomal protein S18 acetylase RimI-like enzyme
VLVEIREIRPIEHEEAGEVLVRAYSEFADPRDPSWQEHLELVRDVAGRVDRTVVLVAVQDDRILGSATIELDGVIGDDDEELPPGVASLRMVGVDPGARRRGVARALIEEVVARCRSAGKDLLILRTTGPMVPAQHLYESMGFQRSPDVDLDWLANGERRTLLGYRLHLR